MVSNFTSSCKWPRNERKRRSTDEPPNVERIARAAPNNGANAQPSPVHYDVNLAPNSVAAATGAGAGLPPSMQQGPAGGSGGAAGPLPSGANAGVLTRPAAMVGGAPGGANAATSLANANAAVTAAAAGANAAASMNRLAPNAAALGVAAGQQGPPSAAAAARNIRGSVAENASNLESIVSHLPTCFVDSYSIRIRVCCLDHHHLPIYFISLVTQNDPTTCLPRFHSVLPYFTQFYLVLLIFT